MAPLPRARPLWIASSTSDFVGRSWSRFGPTLAFAPAAASVWQTRQYFANSSRPCSCVELSLEMPDSGIFFDESSLPNDAAIGSPAPNTARMTAKPTYQ